MNSILPSDRFDGFLEIRNVHDQTSWMFTNVTESETTQHYFKDAV